MNLLDVSGHVAYAFLMVGTYLIGKKYASGWVMCMIGSMLLIAIGLDLNMTSLWIWNIAFFVVQGISLWKWDRHHVGE